VLVLCLQEEENKGKLDETYFYQGLNDNAYFVKLKTSMNTQGLF
jgi:hypothetical protein